MKKLLTIAFIGISFLFIGTDRAPAYDGNDNVDINWVGVDVSTSNNSSAVNFVGAGKYTMYFVQFPTVTVTSFVDIFDSSSAVNATTAYKANWKARIFNTPVSVSSAAVIDASGVPVEACLKEFKYPIKFYRGLAWQASYVTANPTTVGYNQRSK